MSYFDGDVTALSETTREHLEQFGLLKPTDIGACTHRYPICVRRIQPDDTLISIASSDDEDHYSISFNGYERLSELHGFIRFCEALTRSMAHFFEARPHWGKICPIDAAIMKALYPHLAEFQRICEAFDPTGRFRNGWVSRLLSVE